MPGYTHRVTIRPLSAVLSPIDSPIHSRLFRSGIPSLHNDQPENGPRGRRQPEAIRRQSPAEHLVQRGAAASLGTRDPKHGTGPKASPRRDLSKVTASLRAGKILRARHSTLWNELLAIDLSRSDNDAMVHAAGHVH